MTRLLTTSIVALSLTLMAFAAPLDPVGGRDGKQMSFYFDVEHGDQLLTGLPAQDFSLRVDGKPAEFELAQPEIPASIALLVEYSRASWFYFDDIDRAFESFMKTFPEGNWYALATYALKNEIQVDFTKMTGKLSLAYRSLGSPDWDEVNTYDAIYEMLDKMARLPGRRELIVIGSGIDTFSHHTLGDVEKKAREANVRIFCVGTGTLIRGQYESYLSESEQLDLLRTQAFFNMLADETGGEAWFPVEVGAYDGIMKGVAQDFKCAYRMVLPASTFKDGKYHKIDVKAEAVIDGKDKELHVRVRKGYELS